MLWIIHKQYERESDDSGVFDQQNLMATSLRKPSNGKEHDASDLEDFLHKWEPVLINVPSDHPIPVSLRLLLLKGSGKSAFCVMI